MNIGEASRLSGVSSKMIRHYESLGLVPCVPRTEAGYRQYDEDALHTLRFIRRARDLGFDMKEIAALLQLWRNRRRSSAEVKRIALAHVADLEQRIAAMQAMQRTLQQLAHCCAGDGRPDCPILDDLAAEPDKDTRPRRTAATLREGRAPLGSGPAPAGASAAATAPRRPPRARRG
jgi:MerR family transcriptional regulator, copper efflux regulator